MSLIHLDPKYPSRLLSDWGVPIVAVGAILGWIYLIALL